MLREEQIRKQFDQIILVTGAARSGTSMVAGVINMCGAFGGAMSGKTRYNEKGMFENASIRNDIVKPYLRHIKVDPMGQYPLPDVDNINIPTNWRKNIENIFCDQGFTGESQVFYKGAKMCLHWPVWHYAFPNARWIIVRRRTGDIMRSCMKTGFMSAFAREKNYKAVGAKDEREGWLWWVHQHEERFVEMITEGLNCKVIWPERMIRGDYKQLYETLEWLGLEWKSEVLEFIDSKLWHARQRRERVM